MEEKIGRKYLPSQIRSILIIQFGPIGDVLLTTSYLEALLHKFGNARIDFLVHEPNHKVIEDHDHISNIIKIPPNSGVQYIIDRLKVFFKIRRAKYDLVIDQQNNTGSAQIVLVSGAPLKLGYRNGKGRFFYNLKADRGAKRYSGSLKFDILAPLGIVETKYQLSFKIRESSFQYIDNWMRQAGLERAKIICISPGTPVGGKGWNITNYAQLADLILENTDCQVVLLWAPNEYETVEQMKAKMRQLPVVAPSTDINQAAALLKKSGLLICNDGGINHLSVALEVPSLAIFGKTSATVWSPQGAFENHYHLQNPNWVSNANRDFGITPDEAFQKVKEIFEIN